MQVGLVTGRKRIELQERPDPGRSPSPGSAVVEIAYCGICGTDLHAWQSGAPYNPALCGHEWCGTLSAVGDGVDHVREGDRVGIGVPPACGRCRECRTGDAGHCEAVMLAMLGLGPGAPSHGGFAPRIELGAERLYALRAGLSFEDAALLEPATVAVHALRRTPLRLGDAAVVLGAGPIGLLVLQCARIAGAGCVVVVEPHPARAALARRLGAAAVVDPGSEDVAERVRAVCGPLGADVVFECAGVPETIDQAASLARRGGCVALVGLSVKPAQISPASWLAREVELVASIGYLHGEFDVAMQLAEDGRLDLPSLRSDVISLARLEEGFERLTSGAGEVKILVEPRSG